jgi:hypothetical protein
MMPFELKKKKSKRGKVSGNSDWQGEMPGRQDKEKKSSTAGRALAFSFLFPLGAIREFGKLNVELSRDTGLGIRSDARPALDHEGKVEMALRTFSYNVAWRELVARQRRKTGSSGGVTSNCMEKALKLRSRRCLPRRARAHAGSGF